MLTFNIQDINEIKKEFYNLYINNKNIKYIENGIIKKDLFQQMSYLFNNNSIDYALFYGDEGNGKLSSIKYSINLFEIDKPQCITIDCWIFNTDIKLINEILLKFSKIDEIKNNIKYKFMNIDNEIKNNDLKINKFYFNYLDNIFKMKPIVLYLKNIDIIINKNQKIIYNLLETINKEGNKLFLVLYTKDLLLVQNLEKRIKSRLNFKQYNFYHYSYNFFLNILKENIKFEKNNFGKEFLNDLENGILKDELLLKIDLSFSIKSLIDFLYKYILNFKINFKLNLNDFTIITKKSIKDINSGLDFDFNSILIKDLSYPEKYILVFLDLFYDKLAINNYIKLEELSKEIKNIKKLEDIYSFFKFGNELYKLSLLKLYDYGLVEIDKFPLNLKSWIKSKVNKMEISEIKKNLNF